jgi:hypothetical protein
MKLFSSNVSYLWGISETKYVIQNIPIFADIMDIFFHSDFFNQFLNVKK